MAEAPAIESAFARFDLAAIRASLADQAGKGSQFAGSALAALRQKSPTSQAIALRQMMLGGDLSFRGGDGDSNIGSFRASVADTTFTRAFERRSSIRTIGLTGDRVPTSRFRRKRSMPISRRWARMN